MTKKRFILKLIRLSSFLALFILCGYLYFITKSSPPEIQGTIYPTPKNILPFMLKTDSNSKFTEQNLLNKWSIVFFGYTNCPDICPNTLVLLNDFYKTLKTKTTPQIIFVSLDPNRDTVDNINKYVKFFNPNFQAITGSESAIYQLTKDFGVVSNKISQNSANDNQDYFIDHSSHIFLINPEGQIQAIFAAPHKSAQLVKDYSNILKYFNYG